jgi:hypothetical protein
MKMPLRFGHALPDHYGHQMVLFEERRSTFLLRPGLLLQPPAVPKEQGASRRVPSTEWFP